MLGTTIFILLSFISTIIGEPTPEERELADVYSNFTTGVVLALAKDDSVAATLPAGPPGVNPPPVTQSSLFGLAHILAVIHEKSWPVAVPVFDTLLENTPKNLPESYALIAAASDKDPNIKLSSLIFTSEKLELTSGLSKLKVELVNTDLKAGDATETINTQLNKKINTPLEENFIPKDATLCPAAIAIITDTIHLTETWPVPLKKIPGVKFNGKEDVDMVEIVGNYQVIESDKAVEVFIPFKDGRMISLILPYDRSAVLKGDFGSAKPLNLTSVRIQLPAFKVTVRGPQATLASSSKCDFKKEVNFLQFFDEVAYVSLDENKLEAISISAAQINNVEAFKKELSKGNKGKAIDVSTSANKVPVEDKLIVPVVPASGEEKLIVFNTPFTWSILDENWGPIFAGSFESFAFLKNPSAPPKSDGPSVFGSKKSLPFEKCL